MATWWLCSPGISPVGVKIEGTWHSRSFSRFDRVRTICLVDFTVLFPALHNILSPEQVHELGEQFEEQEDELFGEGGFHKTVENVAAIEKQLGIYELSQFTP